MYCINSGEDAGSLEQVGGKGCEKLLDSGYILKAESTELAHGFEIGYRRKRELKSD